MGIVFHLRLILLTSDSNVELQTWPKIIYERDIEVLSLHKYFQPIGQHLQMHNPQGSQNLPQTDNGL